MIKIKEKNQKETIFKKSFYNFILIKILLNTVLIFYLIFNLLKYYYLFKLTFNLTLLSKINFLNTITLNYKCCRLIFFLIIKSFCKFYKNKFFRFDIFFYRLILYNLFFKVLIYNYIKIFQLSLEILLFQFFLFCSTDL